MNKDRTGRQKKGLPSRLLAMILSIALVLGMVPVSSFAAEADNDTRVVDNSTISDWKNLYVGSSTYDAGAVWTDKSVFTDELPTEFQGIDKLEMVDPDNNFLVALSAMASNKEIVGYSTTPTDTILILDLSQSMDNGDSIPQTISAANAAIQSLLDLNKNNRVGVVLYSGNSNFGVAGTNTGKVLLGLNRYTPSSANNYLTYSEDDGETSVNIARNLRIEGATNVISRNNTEKTTIGGTYIQNGLDLAMDEFLKVKDPVIEEANIQGGTTRMPIFVLMSDGAPTSGTPNYTNIGNSTVGNGGATSAGLGFMTQLTAAYALNRVENYYNENAEKKIDAKFYTLGLNLSSQDSDDQYVANSVLNPSTSMTAINGYWDTLFSSAGRVRFTSPGTSDNQYNQDVSVTVTRDTNDGLTRGSQNYVNEYFEADSNADLNAAFSAIVNQIIIQSAYYPTLVDSGNHDLDGYITFEDELGHLMEVKNITGLMLGDNYLYTGEALAEMMGTDEFGDRYTYTELGWELVRTVAERIGISQDVAIELLKAAWADGQLSYDKETGEYSNYIGWYEGADGSYKGYWNETYTADDRPADAKYISLSYGFYGKEIDNTAIEALKSDMMHIVVKVRTEIDTGHQDVVFQIPASLVPVITYHIELDADNFEEAENITLELEEDVAPIRLLFEVGLRSDVNELTVADLAKDEPVDGKYYFYTNQSDLADSYNDFLNYTHDEMYAKLTTDLVTESHFHPSTENERYYYTDDIVIFADQAGNEYTGSTHPSDAGGTYYHAIRVFERTGDGNAAIMRMHYEPIAPETLASAESADDGSWKIEAGTIYQLIGTGYYLEKHGDETNEANITKTFPYVDVPVVHGYGVGESPDTYDIYDFLGNNGRISITPATGIKLTKQVDETVTDADAIYEFVVKLSGVEDKTYTYYAPDGTEGTISFTDGTSEVISLKAGETVYITGLPAGATYTVSETPQLDYAVDTVTINGDAVAGIIASGTIVNQEVQDVEFTNTARGEGSLTVRKTVSHDLGPNYVIPSNLFKITVKLVDVLGNTFARGTVVETSVGKMTVGDDGEISFELANNKDITITGLTAGTDYTVEEALPEDSKFTLTGDPGTRTGKIVADQTKTVELVNDYNPDVPTISIDVTKEVQYEDGTSKSGWSHNFVLEVLKDGTWETVPNVTGTATENDPTFKMTIPDTYLGVVGTHYFRVKETNPGENLTSDTSRYFVVNVSDDDMDGTVEVVITNVQSGNAENHDVTMRFINEYLLEGNVAVEIPIDKDLTNATGVDIPYSSFSFVLKDSANEEVGTYTTDANGDATIHLTYDKADFTGALDNGKATFIYTLEEVKPARAGMTYSSEVYEIEVVLVDKEGKLVLESMTITNSSNEEVEKAKFVNEFKLDPATLNLSGTKNLTGRDISAGEFKFELYETDSDFVIDDKAVLVASAYNTVKDNVGEFSFAHSITTAGVHYYVVKENSAYETKAKVDYDGSVYHVTVVVGDGGAGSLVITNKTVVKAGSRATSEEPIVFNNVYTPTPIRVAIEGEKEFTGGTLTSGMFEFVLTGENVNETVKNVGNKFTFSEIEYTKAGTYVYTVVEKAPTSERKGYTYDDSSFKVTVVISDNPNEGNLKLTSITYTETDGNDEHDGDDGNALIFRNIYEVEEARVALEAYKLLENRELEGSEFSFQVFKANEEFEIVDSTFVTEASNGALDENNEYDVNLIKFAPFPIYATGTYYYVMKEAKGADVNVTYDEIEYQITLVVYDVGGQLSYHATYALKGQVIEDVVFSNVYTPPVEKDVFEKGKEDISIDGEVVTAGDVLTYEITYTNKSDKDSANVTITDTIPAGTTYVEGSAEDAVYNEAERKLTWTFDNVAPGTSVTVDFDVKVDAADVDIENTAYALIGENTYESNTVYNYTYHKVVDKTAAKLGEELEYTISYENLTGSQAEVVIVDELAAGLTYVEGSATKDGVYDSETHTITWTFMAEIDEVGEVSFKAVINENAVKVIDNVATVQVGHESEVKTNAVETVLSTPVVTIGKTQAVNVKTGEVVDATDKLLEVEAGDIVTYYLTVKNAKGAGTAYNVEIEDEIPKGLVVQSISDGGVADSEGTISWPVIDELNAGESITVSFSVAVPAVEKETTWTNVGYVSHEESKDSIPSNEVKVVEEVDGLTITKAQKVNDGKATTGKQKVAAGDKVTYEITLLNAEGASDATNVVVTDEVPAGLVVDENTISHKGALKNGVITWSFDTIEAGESITVSFQVTVPDVDKDTEWKNIATVVTDDDEEEPSEEVIIEEGVAKVDFTKAQKVNDGAVTTEKQKVVAGDKVTYEITVKSKGTEAAADIVITDEVPAGLVVDESSISHKGTLKDGIITWTVDSLEVGESLTVSFQVTVPDVDKRTEWKNIAVVTFDDDDKETTEEVIIEDNTPDVSVTKVQQVGLLGSASKDDQKVEAGDVVVYRIVVTNNGTGTAEGITIVDEIPAGLSLVKGTISDGGKVADGVITWTIDELKAGASEEVCFAVKVPEVNEAVEWSNIATMTYENDPTESDEPHKTNEVVFTIQVKAPDMGDSSPVTMWTSLAFASLMVCAVLIINNKKRNEEA